VKTDSLVEHAIALVNRAERDGIHYGDVWCVFDRDSLPGSNFAPGFELALAHRLHVAWSNEAFELWYLLHFIYDDTAIPHHEYAKRWALHFRSDKAGRSIYERLKDHQTAALRNAQRWSDTVRRWRSRAWRGATHLHGSTSWSSSSMSWRTWCRPDPEP
jgi:hypothetical protein